MTSLFMLIWFMISCNNISLININLLTFFLINLYGEVLLENCENLPVGVIPQLLNNVLFILYNADEFKFSFSELSISSPLVRSGFFVVNSVNFS